METKMKKLRSRFDLARLLQKRERTADGVAFSSWDVISGKVREVRTVAPDGSTGNGSRQSGSGALWRLTGKRAMPKRAPANHASDARCQAAADAAIMAAYPPARKHPKDARELPKATAAAQRKANLTKADILGQSCAPASWGFNLSGRRECQSYLRNTQLSRWSSRWSSPSG
jgi:hypothetical protein